MSITVSFIYYFCYLPQMVSCNGCGRFFKKRGLNSHMRHCKGGEKGTTTGRRLSLTLPDVVNQCQLCSMKFKTVQGLKTHERFCKGKVVEPSTSRRLSTTLPVSSDNVCTVCGDLSATPTGLKMHILYHRKQTSQFSP